MIDGIMNLFSMLLYLFKGYCIQFFFNSFAEPKLYQLKSTKWAIAIVWLAIKMSSEKLFSDTISGILSINLLFTFVLLFLFCVCWYKGNILLKIFLTIQFISLHELSFWAVYSLFYIGNQLIGVLAYKAENSMILIESLNIVVNILSCFFVALVGIAQCTLLFISIKNIVKSYYYKEKGKMNKEVLFYLLPAMAGVFVAILIRLLMITITDGIPVLLYEKYTALYLIIPSIALVLLIAVVFSFRIYQDMVILQEEKAEKIILENQMIQMQSSMVKMEHLCDGIRSIKHDIKNHVTVLQNLFQKKHSLNNEEEEQIYQYFKDICQSIEQIDNRVHTGNAVSDVVIDSKFSYAKKQMKNIQLNADDFILPNTITIKAYDIGIILNNGLDNAIEACMKIREKQPNAEVYITIRSFKVKNMYFIEIVNSFNGMILFQKNSDVPISTKTEKEMHGIGLKNIRKCAVKYGGDMDCIVEGNKFILSVMIKIN